MSDAEPVLLQAGNRPAPRPGTLLPFHDPDFIPPTYEDLRAVNQQYGLTGAEVAQRKGVSSRTVRKWLAPPQAANHSPIPYAAWRLLLIEIGAVRLGPARR